MASGFGGMTGPGGGLSAPQPPPPHVILPRVPKFNFERDAPLDSTVLLIGKRGTGKSYAVGSIMFEMRNRLDTVFGMNETEESSGTLARFCPPTHIISRFDPQHLARVLNFQKNLIGQSRRTGTQHWKNIGFIMDDCVDDSSKMKSPEITEVHKNGRHRRLFTVNATQYVLDIPRSIRGQIDIIVILKTVNAVELDLIYDTFCKGLFDNNRALFDRVFTLCTNDRGAFVICVRRHDPATNTSKPTNGTVADSVFWYRAPSDVPERFRVGKRVYWLLSEYFWNLDESKMFDLRKAAEAGPLQELHAQLEKGIGVGRGKKNAATETTRALMNMLEQAKMKAMMPPFPPPPSTLASSGLWNANDPVVSNGGGDNRSKSVRKIGFTDLNTIMNDMERTGTGKNKKSSKAEKMHSMQILYDTIELGDDGD